MKIGIPCFLVLIISFVLNTTNTTNHVYYSTKTPYKPPLSALRLPAPPTDFELVCAQIVARHGCRALEGRKYDRLTMALWTQAKNEEALTDYGQQFGEDLRYFIAVNDQLGRGELSGLGKREHHDLAQRLTHRLLPLFERNLFRTSSGRIRVVSSGKARTIASLNAFVKGLPSSLASFVDREPPNPSLLLFHENHKYQAYLKRDKQLKHKLRSINMQQYSRQMAHNVLVRLYKQSFIDKLTHGYYSITDDDSGKSIRNEVDAVRMLHALYLIGSNLREEGVGSLLEKYFEEDESAWFAYLHDAKDYYEKGPSFANRTNTYDMARILLDDFFLDSEKCSQIEATHFLRARFAHAETIIPFAALLKLPVLSDQQTPLNDTYSYETNGWRGELVSPMTANIQWEIYRHSKYDKTRRVLHPQILIRMLLNEYPVPFKYECKPYSTIYNLFYTLDELKQCYNLTDP